MTVKQPIAEHIQRDRISEIAGLLRNARLVPLVRGADGKTSHVPTQEAIASYSEALGLIAVFKDTATPRQLFELHDMLRDFPKDIYGTEGKEMYESLRDSLIEQYRAKTCRLSGWGFE
jgi:hypothetical protein